MKLLDRSFERIVVISLAGRRDRRERCAAHLAERDLADRPQWFDAVDGRSDPPPHGWNAGSGAWGCHASHMAILRQALRDRLDSVLILEDDAIFSAHTAGELPAFLRAVPEDWGQIYLGGQHLHRPQPTPHPLVWRGVNVNRTHAYAVSGREAGRIADYLDQWRFRRNTSHHIDHHLGLAQRMRLWAAYCPVAWFAGQMEAVSDINLGDPNLPERWWHFRGHSAQLPIVTVPGNARLTAKQAAVLQFPSRRKAGGAATLYTQLLQLAARAATHGQLPAWRGPAAECRLISQLWPGPVISLREVPAHCPHRTLNPTMENKAT